MINKFRQIFGWLSILDDKIDGFYTDRLKLSKKYRHPVKGVKKLDTEEKKLLIAQERAKGKSITQISKDTGIPRSTVGLHVKNLPSDITEKIYVLQKQEEPEYPEKAEKFLKVVETSIFEIRKKLEELHKYLMGIKKDAIDFKDKIFWCKEYREQIKLAKEFLYFDDADPSEDLNDEELEEMSEEELEREITFAQKVLKGLEVRKEA